MSFAEYPQKLYLCNVSGSFSSAELGKQRLKSSSVITKEQSYQGSSVLTEQSAALQYC